MQMAIYIDPPLWPAHGTIWSHLVSDASYAELHRFAAALGLPRRSFDLDHYDVPASIYDRAVASGARAVSSRDVVHVLRDSGLRVKHVARATARPGARLTYLREEWAALLPALGPDAPVGESERWQGLGAELIERWNEPHRSYHDLRHLEEVLLALDHLRTRGEPITPITLLAAWFHDAVYSGVGDQDEAESARFAGDALERFGLPVGAVVPVRELIIATLPGAGPAETPPAAVHLLDADLSIFASPAARYAEYTSSVRAEYAHVASEDFRLGRARILRSYLDRPFVYRSPPAQAMWEARARANLTREVGELEQPRLTSQELST